MFPLIPMFPLWEHLDNWYKKVKSRNFVRNDVFYSLHSKNKQINELSRKNKMMGIKGLTMPGNPCAFYSKIFSRDFIKIIKIHCIGEL